MQKTANPRGELTNQEWGNFFHPSVAPFGYNETVATEHLPLNRSDALSKGFNWSDYQSLKPNMKSIITAGNLPDNINDVPADIVDCAIECEITKKLFRITQQELKF